MRARSFHHCSGSASQDMRSSSIQMAFAQLSATYPLASQMCAKSGYGSRDHTEPVFLIPAQAPDIQSTPMAKKPCPG